MGTLRLLEVTAASADARYLHPVPLTGALAVTDLPDVHAQAMRTCQLEKYAKFYQASTSELCAPTKKPSLAAIQKQQQYDR